MSSLFQVSGPKRRNDIRPQLGSSLYSVPVGHFAGRVTGRKRPQSGSSLCSVPVEHFAGRVTGRTPCLLFNGRTTIYQTWQSQHWLYKSYSSKAMRNGEGVRVDRNRWHFQIIPKKICLVLIMGHLWVMSDPMDLNDSITNTQRRMHKLYIILCDILLLFR